MLGLILMVFAFVLAVVAGVLSNEPWRWRLLCFSLACFFLSDLMYRQPIH